MNWGMMSDTQRDRAYNNTEAVPNSAELIAARNAASAAFRASHPAGLDQPYGAAERNKWDVYGDLSSGAPCWVFIHGGYWQRGGREDFAILAQGILAHGWSAALCGYTLAPEATMTALVAEIGAALDWLAARATGKIIVTGWSAGGHLTAMALRHPGVHAAIAMSGVFELGPIRDTYLNEKLRMTDTEIETLSPLRLPVVPKPMAITYGSRELATLVNDSRDLHAKRAAAHAPGPLIPVAGADHFTILDEVRAADGLLTRAALALV